MYTASTADLRLPVTLHSGEPWATVEEAWMRQPFTLLTGLLLGAVLVAWVLPALSGSFQATPDSRGAERSRGPGEGKRQG